MITFSIDAAGSGWTVNRDGVYCATFPNELGAINAAIHAAQYEGNTGPKSARVTFLHDGAQHQAWQYGNDYLPFAV